MIVSQRYAFNAKLEFIYLTNQFSLKKALQSFKPNAYDLAILDIRMPAMTGFQLYREMKSRDPVIAVCFLSAFEIEPDEFKSVFPSMDGVKTIIKKPYQSMDC